MSATLEIKKLGRQSYQECWQAMRNFTETRSSDTPDELWLVEHTPVFTLGQAGKSEHILNPHDIKIVNSDRGGQVTYHGPGQIVIYTLIDIKRLGLGARALVTAIENSVINSLRNIDIHSAAKKEAPGVYVNSTQSPNNAKIAALGLRIRKGCSYHGLSVNFDMDLSPFSYINPCGYEGQAVTQVKDLSPNILQSDFEEQLLNELAIQLGHKR